MIKEAIGIADTIDEARKIATQNLNAPIDADVKVEIVSMPKKKVLGLFGGADAKVKAFYDDGVEEPKKAPEKKQESKKRKELFENSIREPRLFIHKTMDKVNKFKKLTAGVQFCTGCFLPH